MSQTPTNDFFEEDEPVEDVVQAFEDGQKLKWTDLIGIDPDYTGGKPVREFLEESRGES